MMMRKRSPSNMAASSCTTRKRIQPINRLCSAAGSICVMIREDSTTIPTAVNQSAGDSSISVISIRPGLGLRSPARGPGPSQLSKLEADFKFLRSAGTGHSASPSANEPWSGGPPPAPARGYAGTPSRSRSRSELPPPTGLAVTVVP